MTWKPPELIQAVEAVRGSEAAAELRPPCNAVAWKNDAVRYHYRESQKLYEKIKSDDLHGVTAAIMGVPLTGSRSELADARFAAECHVIAAAQSLHSIADIMGKVIWIALDLDSKLQLVVSERYFGRVLNEMKKQRIARSVTDLMDRIRDANDFKYLADFVNTAKHQSLVDTRHQVSFVAGRHGLRIQPFNKSRSNDTWPEKWTETFLEDAHQAVIVPVAQIGNELTQIVKQDTGTTP